MKIVAPDKHGIITVVILADSSGEETSLVFPGNPSWADLLGLISERGYKIADPKVEHQDSEYDVTHTTTIKVVI